MKKLLAVAVLLFFSGVPMLPQSETPLSYLGFDRNEYPGDRNLKELRATFSYSSYWLNNPPGTSVNTWLGKRSKLEAAGFGFAVLFNGRLYRELGSEAQASTKG